MSKKREKHPIQKGQLIFVIINAVLVIGILGFFGYRALYYRDYFDMVSKNASFATLQTVLIQRMDPLEEHDGLFENEDGTYTYRNNPKDNYIALGNNLYRIMDIGVDGEIRIISEKVLTLAMLSENDTFENTSAYTWLNYDATRPNSGLFEQTLDYYGANLIDGPACYLTITDLENINCDLSSRTHAAVSIPSVKDYLEAGGQDSYLNNGENYWLCNQDRYGDYYYIDHNGKLGIQTSDGYSYGLRPILTLSPMVVATGGQGTKEDPYVLANLSATKSSGLAPGDYVQYGTEVFRVCQNDGTGVLCMLDGLVYEKGSVYTCNYSKTNVYSLQSGAGQYLNTTYLKTLPYYEEVMQPYDVNYGLLGLHGSYSYLSCFDNAVNCYVGLPNTSFMYLNDYDGYFVTAQNYQSDKLIYSVSDGIFFADFITKPKALRPVICLSEKISIKAGTGTASDPYQLDLSAYEVNDGE